MPVNARNDINRERASTIGGGGALGAGAARDRANAALDITGPRNVSIGQGLTGKNKGKKKDTTALPPGLNPLKYESNPTPSYEATPENIAKVVGTIISAVAGPVGTAAQAAYTGYKALTDDEFDPLNPFEKPTGTTSTGTYDKSEVVNASTGTGASQMGANPIVGKTSAEQKKKKKVATKPGFTLLQGVGGTLLGT